MEQIHVFYSGTVQGVGFRYRTRLLAKEFGVYGWVKNLPDGRVELVAQAKQKSLKDFLNQLDFTFDGYITGKQISKQIPQESFNNFSISF